MVKLPEVSGLIPCEEFRVDPVARRLSLIGLFLALRFGLVFLGASPLRLGLGLFGEGGVTFAGQLDREVDGPNQDREEGQQ